MTAPRSKQYQRDNASGSRWPIPPCSIQWALEWGPVKCRVLRPLNVVSALGTFSSVTRGSSGHQTFRADPSPGLKYRHSSPFSRRPGNSGLHGVRALLCSIIVLTSLIILSIVGHLCRTVHSQLAEDGGLRDGGVHVAWCRAPVHRTPVLCKNQHRWLERPASR